MADILKQNAEYAEKMRTILKLRAEPVAVKLIKEGGDFPDATPQASQMSHCQAVFRARKGECIKLPYEMNNCHVGASVLGMLQTPEKIANGEFHASTAIHDNVAAAKEMIDKRLIVPFKTVGEAVCPLKSADFVPDVVVVVDIAERIYWIVSMMSAASGGREEFSTAPFQCACEDVVVIPMLTGRPNVSLGCFGCRKKTDMTPDELAVGVPYSLIPEYVARLERYKDGPMAKAKRD